uniref:Uncharacterized protein n=1 Tax=Salarias fasciatus TaxID=181472 RepID=A0A672HZ03_SALFA
MERERQYHFTINIILSITITCMPWYEQSPFETPSLKKRNVDAPLKLAAQHLDEPEKYWDNTLDPLWLMNSSY